MKGRRGEERGGDVGQGDKTIIKSYQSRFVVLAGFDLCSQRSVLKGKLKMKHKQREAVKRGKGDGIGGQCRREVIIFSISSSARRQRALRTWTSRTRAGTAVESRSSNIHRRDINVTGLLARWARHRQRRKWLLSQRTKRRTSPTTPPPCKGKYTGSTGPRSRPSVLVRASPSSTFDINSFILL